MKIWKVVDMGGENLQEAVDMGRRRFWHESLGGGQHENLGRRRDMGGFNMKYGRWFQHENLGGVPHPRHAMPHAPYGNKPCKLDAESQKSILDVFPLRAALAENSHAWPKIGSQRPQSQFHPNFSCFFVFSLLESAEVPFCFLADQEAQLQNDVAAGLYYGGFFLQLPDRSSPKPASLLVRSRNCSCWSLQSIKRLRNNSIKCCI